MLFAVSDAVWFALIAAVGLAIKQYFDWRQSQVVAGKVEAVRLKAIEAANDVAEVKTTLQSSTAEHGEKLSGIAQQVEIVRKESNGMKDELVREVRQASFAAGVKSETDKGDKP